ncbi:MAG TPA: CvpA family protein [Flavisolibacter sp.]|nr:CvpA family protein [Flavisolibacter sp.]
MIIDIIVIALLIMAIVKGLRNGLVLAVFSLLAFIIGLAAALKLSAVVAAYLENSTNISQRWLPVLAFALVFFLVVLLVRLGAKAIEGVLQLAMLGWLNRLGGVLLYIILYLFIFSIILFYAYQLRIIKPETAEVSLTYRYIYPMAPQAMNVLGSVIPFFKDMFTRLEAFFLGISEKAS